MSQNPPNLQTAITLWNSGERGRARSELEALVVSQPANESAWLWLARTADDPKQQKNALLRVLEINPQNDVARRVLAERFPGEVTRRSQVLDLLGEAAFSDDWVQAEKLYSQIVRVDPAQADALDALLDHYAKTVQWNKGFKLLAYCRDKLPDHPDLIRRQVEFSAQSGDPEALRMLDDILLTNPAVTVDMLLKASEVFAKISQYQIVSALLERAHQLDARNQTVLYGLARAYEVTKRPKEAKLVRQRIADIDHKSGVGKNMLAYLLEEDPYVPLAMRENTLVALREALGLMLPFLLLAIMDHRFQLVGIDQVLAVVLAFLGGYLLVTATSSHEQKVWKSLLAGEMNETLRYIFGTLGSVLVMIALFFSLHTSASQVDQMAEWEGEACDRLVKLVEDNSDEPLNATYPEGEGCNWLREYFYEEYYRREQP